MATVARTGIAGEGNSSGALTGNVESAVLDYMAGRAWVREQWKTGEINAGNLQESMTYYKRKCEEDGDNKFTLGVLNALHDRTETPFCQQEPVVRHYVEEEPTNEEELDFLTRLEGDVKTLAFWRGAVVENETARGEIEKMLRTELPADSIMIADREGGFVVLSHGSIKEFKANGDYYFEVCQQPEPFRPQSHVTDCRTCYRSGMVGHFDPDAVARVRDAILRGKTR